MIGRGGRSRRAGVGGRVAAAAGRASPTARPPANASRFAARSRVGRNASPGAGAPGRPLPSRNAAPPPRPDRRPEARRPPRPNTRSRSRSRPSSRSPPGRRAQVRPDHQLGRDLEQEPRRHRRLAHPPRRAPPGVRQEQPPLRAGDADVGEPPLLLELLLVVERPAVREEALLEAGDEHDRELQALRGVERDQRDRVGVALVRVLVGDERGLLEQPVEGVLRRRGRRSGS